MDEQRWDDQLEPIFKSSVPIQGIALKTDDRDRWRKRVREIRVSSAT